jgi:Cof subfamily protein (haloacid dehalogenase superfamily)
LPINDDNDALEDGSIYSLIALDIDGTMIGEDRIVHSDLVGAIARVQSLGAIVSIATGRTLAPAMRVAEQAGATGPIICFQGAMTFDQSTRSEIRHVRLDEGVAITAISALTSAVSEVMMFLGDDVWVEQRSEWTDGYSQRMGVVVRDTGSLKTMADRRPTAVVGVGDPAIVGPLVEDLHRRLNGSALVTHSLPMFCEVEAIGAGKDNALAHMTSKIGIGQAEVVAVGDGKGDQSMIEWAGLGVAIENGHPDALAVADMVIAQPERSGLAEFLESLADSGKIGPSPQAGITKNASQ